MKVLLILVDGMRADSFENCKSAQAFMKKSAYTLNAQTVMPSVWTLPASHIQQRLIPLLHL